MRKLSKATSADQAADQKTATEQGSLFAIRPETGAGCSDQATKTALAVSPEGQNPATLQTAPLQAGSDGDGATADGGPIRSQATLQPETATATPKTTTATPQNQGFSQQPGPDSGLIANSQTTKATKSAAVAAYLSGFGRCDGDVMLMQRAFFRNPALWADRRVIELNERLAKANAHFDATVPDWSDPIPSGDAQANSLRLVLKAMGIEWEARLLQAHRANGLDDPTTGYKGMRLYLCASNDMAARLMDDVLWQMRIGAPGMWHGDHLVQLAEADWVVTLDHPAAHYAPSPTTIDVPASPAPVAIPRPSYPAGWRPTAAELQAIGWNADQAAYLVQVLSATVAGPVRLSDVMVVQDTAIWLDRLAVDAMDGPTGPRARTKALQGDVRLFWAAISGKAAA